MKNGTGDGKIEMALQKKLCEIFPVQSTNAHRAVQWLANDIISKSKINEIVDPHLLQQHFDRAIVMIIALYEMKGREPDFKNGLQALRDQKALCKETAIIKLNKEVLENIDAALFMATQNSYSSKYMPTEFQPESVQKDPIIAHGAGSPLKYLVQRALTALAYIADLVANYRKPHRTSSSMVDLPRGVEWESTTLIKSSGLNTKIDCVTAATEAVETEQEEARAQAESTAKYFTPLQEQISNALSAQLIKDKAKAATKTKAEEEKAAEAAKAEEEKAKKAAKAEEEKAKKAVETEQEKARAQAESTAQYFTALQEQISKAVSAQLIKDKAKAATKTKAEEERNRTESTSLNKT